jgi:hypothetical protein
MNNTEVKHTPLPWIKSDEMDGEIMSKNYPVCQIRGWSYLLKNYGVDAPKIQDANLAFILEACNNYYTLKESTLRLQKENEEKDKRIADLQKMVKEAEEIGGYKF